MGKESILCFAFELGYNSLNFTDILDGLQIVPVGRSNIIYNDFFGFSRTYKVPYEPSPELGDPSSDIFLKPE